ncbi:altronate oxidoreductase [Halobacillus andaensis]|uniref:Altronate oxidoreductase n=1 Tax=Halobacillus andaensis TaxID=1176239 RepID=A0A917B5W7_HALAA|nr:tagaturonate reductase [Halobacillus andaensis]MBP2006032.1 tagaturonate reductase [Halobacillus andaensis]GGF24129.1 altronate oxidoreductase [Halobacillus andaensis]
MPSLNKANVSDLPNINQTDQTLINKQLPERAIQFGEGNFLRAYINWMLQQMNKQDLFNGRTVAIQPTPHGKVVPKLNKQDGLFTTILQGIEDGEEKQDIEINSSISRSINPYEDLEELLKLAESEYIEFIFSNTTEAGLVYMEEAFPETESPLSFPGKLTALLYRRFTYRNGDPESGFTIIPCELVENNGNLLQSIVLRLAKEWELPAAFCEWVENDNTFCNTLVDRIVPGYPKDTVGDWEQKLGYKDTLMAVGEPFHLFVIESGQPLEKKLPFQKAGLNVKWDQVKPYRDLKVSLLNAPHTLLFSVGFISGLNTVREVMEDEVVSSYVRRVIYEDILPHLSFNRKEKESFADSVIERFQNPFVKHQLADLGLNAVQKLKSRVFPLLNQQGNVPSTISFSLASLIHYYKPYSIHEGHFMGLHEGRQYKVRDNEVVLETFIDFWRKDQHTEEDVARLLSIQKLWERDLSHLTECVFEYFKSIDRQGAKAATQQMLENVLPVENQK